MTIRELLDFACEFEHAGNPLDYEIVISDKGDSIGLTTEMLEMEQASIEEAPFLTIKL